MGDVVYKVEIPITRIEGPLRHARLPADERSG